MFQERRNVKRLNSRKVCDPGFGAPIPKPVGRSQVRAPCVIVTDLRGRVKKLLNPLRTQVRAVRFGTPPDFEDGLVELRNRQLGSVTLSYHQLAALMAQAKDGRHLTQLGNAEIRAAKKFRKLAYSVPSD